MTSTSVSSHTRNGKPVRGYRQQRSGNGATPKHASQRARRAVGGSVAGAAGINFLASSFNFGSSLFNFGAAVFTVAGGSLLAWGGYKRRKRRKRRKTNQLGLPRGRRPQASHGRRSLTPAQMRARTDGQLAKRQQRHEWRTEKGQRRRAAIVSGLHTVQDRMSGPSRTTSRDWDKLGSQS